MAKGAFQELVYDTLRRNWGIQGTPIDSPELKTKYKVEASDSGVVTAALTPSLVAFLIKERPPTGLIHLGSDGLDIVVTTDFRKIDEIDALVRYGTQLAQKLKANEQSGAVAHAAV
jgi:hypothetical protein